MIRSIITILFSAVIIIISLSVNVSAQENSVCPEHIFKIAKTDNENVIYYDASFTDGLLNHKRPVRIYWRIHEKKGQVEELSLIEKSQFYLDIQEIEYGKNYIVHVRNKLLSNKLINVTLDDDGCVRGKLVIAGKETYLKDILAHIDPDSGFIPNVLYVDFMGNDLKTGERITERVIND